MYFNKARPIREDEKKSLKNRSIPHKREREREVIPGERFEKLSDK